MKTLRNFVPLVLALISIGISAFLFTNRSVPTGTQNGGATTIDPAGEEAVIVLRKEIADLSKELRDVKRTLGNVVSTSDDPEMAGGDNGESRATNKRTFTSLDDRLRSLESSMARLNSNYEGLTIEGASEERAQIFASDEGSIKADEYFEAGKFSIAAEGYMTFYRNHLDDPDARSVLKRARQSYGRAGYPDMAIWLQEEMMEFFPENRVEDLNTLAELKKESGQYADAIAHAEEAANLTKNPQSRLWTRMYWAWYNELDGGLNAGLDAYRQVQQEVEDAGFTDHALNARAEEKIDEILKQIAAKN